MHSCTIAKRILQKEFSRFVLGGLQFLRKEQGGHNPGSRPLREDNKARRIFKNRFPDCAEHHIWLDDLRSMFTSVEITFFIN